MGEKLTKAIRLPFGIELHVGRPENPGELRFEHSLGRSRLGKDGEWKNRCTRNRYRITRWFGISKIGWGFIGIIRFGHAVYENASSFELHDDPFAGRAALSREEGR